MANFKVTIVGGGIGGLMLAAGLLRRGVPIEIYEAAPAFTEIGLGLSLGPAAYRSMPCLDPALLEIFDRLVTTHADSPGYEAFRETWFELVWACGVHEGDVLMNLKAKPTGQTAVRRADFLNALVALIPSDVVHFGKKLVGLTEGEGIKLKFEDGDVVQADVVIGCDGIRSRVKEFISELCPRPRYSGMYAYRAVLDMDEMIEAVGDKRARVASMYMGQGVYTVTYPIMRAEKVNVGIFVLSDEWTHDAWVRPAKHEDMRRDTKDMGRYVKAIIEVCGGFMHIFIALGLLLQHMHDPSQWAIFEHPHIPTYARSRVAIMGDAAHASTPHQGAGAGQAIEDAHVLAELLGDQRVRSVDDAVLAFQAYDDIRRPRTQRVVTSSKENADLLCLCFKGVKDDPERLKEAFGRRLGWLWDLDVEDQVERARQRMVEYLEGSSSLFSRASVL